MRRIQVLVAITLLAACDAVPDETRDAGEAEDAASIDRDAGASGGDAGDDRDEDAGGASGGGRCDLATSPASFPVSDSGDDFFADSDDALRFSESACVQIRFGEPHDERVYAIDLGAGQTVGVCERGPMRSALYVVSDCRDETIECLAAVSEVAFGEERHCLRYSATEAERVFVVVESYNTEAQESEPAYDIELGLDPTCGDGSREPGEECDDGGTTPNDGCDERCFIEEDARCYELGGPSRCAPGGCGDGCVYGDTGSECTPPALTIGQEECDDFNTTPGDGCDAACDVEDGFDCSGVQPPSVCWEEPRYTNLRPTSATVSDTKPGMRIVTAHQVHLSVAAALRITVTVSAFGAGADPSEVHPDEPVEVRPELLLHEPARDLVISLTDGSANLAAGEYTLRLRSGAERVGEYTYALAFGPAL